MPTRTTKAGFHRLCQRHQQNENTYCHDTCRGKLIPPEVEFLDLQTLEEKIMGQAKVTFTACELCGETKNTKNNHGKQVCCNCEPVWRMVNNKPETALEMLITKKGEDWVQYRLPVLKHEANPATVADCEQLRTDLNNLQAILDSVATERDIAVQNLKESTLSFHTVMANAAAERETEEQKLRDYINTLENELDRAKAGFKTPAATAWAATVAPSRDAVLLDLALGVIEGRVVGVDAATINVLRTQ
jgi:hypothetical protein